MSHDKLYYLESYIYIIGFHPKKNSIFYQEEAERDQWKDSIMVDFYFFNLPKINPDQLSPAVWAYVGDAVYELFIRHHLLTKGPDKTKNLHHKAISKVRASFQAELVNKMGSFLTDAELEIIKRGRNVKSGHVPNGSDPITYRYSTAFEALIGYLYLKEEYSRLREILQKTVELGEDGRESGDRSCQ